MTIWHTVLFQTTQPMPMKRLYLFIPLLLASLSVPAQLSLGTTYQAVARQGGGLLTNQAITVRMLIREGSVNGPSVYEELHQTQTNDYGLFSLTIGKGNPVLGTWTQIDWGAAEHYLRVELDAGTGFYNLGIQQIEAVPYSLYAEKARMFMGDILDTDLDSLEGGMILRWNGTNWIPSFDQNTVYTAGLGIDIDPQNQIRNLGDVNPADDLLLGSAASGDLTGTYPNPSVYRVQGQPFAAQAAQPGQVWKWNGTKWNPAADDAGAWTESGNTIHYLGTGVGIGTSNPLVPLHVATSQRVLFGDNLNGPGTRMFWVADKGAFRAGNVATGPYATFWDVDSIGDYSIGFGRRTRAIGPGTFVAGYSNTARGQYSFALGSDNQAEGDYAATWNRNNIAAGQGATAMGYFTRANGDFSVTMGRNVLAQSYASLVIGRYNEGGGTTNQWVNSDSEPLFEVGIGNSIFTPSNALTVFKSGLVRVHQRLQIGTSEEFQDAGSASLSLNAHLSPTNDGTRSLGRSSNRWNTIYALNGVINTSDKRDKTDISPLSYGLAEILKLQPVSYRWKAYPLEGVKLGLIAQDLRTVLPEVVVDQEWVVDEESGELRSQPAARLGVTYSDLIPVLVQGMQEQQQIIVQQQEALNALQKQLTQQAELLARLEERLHQNH